MFRRLAAVIVTAAFCVACPTHVNKPPPSDTTDAGNVDAGDSDAGNVDAGSSDAGSSDAGSTDAGSANVSPVDASYDVVVVGAGTGGSSAAIEAARLGARVALVEETDCVGGQMNCAGVTTMDEGNSNAERQDGIYKELIDNVRAVYGSRPVGTCYWGDGSFCFEPNVGQSVLRNMLTDAGVTLYTRIAISGFTAGTSPQVTSDRGDRFVAQVVIDATEYGDLLPLAGVDYRAGNSQLSSGLNPNACVQDITYTAVIKKYSGPVPPELVIGSPPGGVDAYNIAAQKFRRYITAEGSDSLGGSGPYSWKVHIAYRGLPDSSNATYYTATDPAAITKTDINWANDFPYSVGTLDRANRKTINCQAKLETLQFIYYAQTELGQPSWSVANDTGYDSPWNIEENSCPNISADLKPLERLMPPIPYVRESRRLVGVSTITGNDILRVDRGAGTMAQRNWVDGAALGHYMNDLHNCNGSGTLEPDLETLAQFQDGVSGPFQVPLSALIPATVDGLLAAEKNFSQSRLVNAASRLQPSTMLIGQAAGALAALSVSEHVTPRQVPAVHVQAALTHHNHRISRFDYLDIPRSSTYWAAGQIVSTAALMTGVGGSPPQFGASLGFLRRHAAEVIALYRGYSVTAPAVSPFSDVPTTDLDFPALNAVWREGLLNECSAPAGTRQLCPDDPISRGEMAALLSRAFALPQVTSGEAFQDIGTSPYYGYIQGLAVLGLAEPCPGIPIYFCPAVSQSLQDGAASLARFVVVPEKAATNGPIHVIAGTYAANVGAAHGNVTALLTTACEGMTQCTYPVDSSVLGNPFSGQSRDYFAEWTCIVNGPTLRAWVPAEASGHSVQLTCQ